MELGPLLSYWRNCLADSERQSPSWQRAVYFRLDAEEIRTGRLSRRSVSEIFAQADEPETSKPTESGVEKTEPPRPVPLLISPFVLNVEVEHGERLHQRAEGRQAHAPLWLPAILMPSGELVGDLDHSPWIGRQYLAPAGSSALTLGTLKSADQYRGRRDAPRNGSWEAYRDDAKRLLRAVTGRAYPPFPNVAHNTISGPVAILGKKRTGASAWLLNLYDDLRKDAASCSPLLKAFVGPQPTDAAPADSVDEPPQPPEVDYLGHMSRDFGLEGAQRRALRAALALGGAETQAVDGPPGTGKTTLLQSVVASLWVEGALAGGEPPLLHACTSNNRAIENILITLQPEEVMADDVQDDYRWDGASDASSEAFSARWIGESFGYGLCMPSQARASRFVDKYPVALQGFPLWGELPARLENADFVHQADLAFTARARTVFGDPTLSVEKAVERLHALLVESRDRLLEISALWRRAAVDRGTREQVRARLRIIEGFVELVERSSVGEDVSDELRVFAASIPSSRDGQWLEPFLRMMDDAPVEPSRVAARQELRDYLDASLHRLRLELHDLETRRSSEDELAGALRRAALPEVVLPGGPTPEEALKNREIFEKWLDVTLRRRLFHLAGRYWEGRWILEVQGLLAEDPDFARKQSREACTARFRRFAKLTPLSVSTFYKVPSLFKYFDGAQHPLDSLFDLLIVDEAGQTAPEIGVPALHYAKRALIVGDVHQIEPIWGVGRRLDDANAEAVEVRFPKRHARAFRSSEGNLMLLAQRASRYRDASASSIFLADHFRCLPAIIDYCNQLVYGQRLAIRRAEPETQALPAMGWAHIAGDAKRVGSSWVNEVQAMGIAQWLLDNVEFLEEHYGSLEHVGVVTPFSAQARALRRQLVQRKLTKKYLGFDLEVGTVHTFQGGEKKVMIFSSVYTAGRHQHFFFDAGPNMLNVAVSRARESFLMFGDQAIFRSGLQTPSGRLAGHLLRHPSQEVTDVWPASLLTNEPIYEVVDSLAGHRSVLREALETVSDHLLIVSPYLAASAIEADGIADLIEAARSRGARVVVAYTPDLAESRSSLDWAESMLERAGAELWALERAHEKVLAVDSSWAVIGSFNWLSANRERGSDYQRSERSVVLRGQRATDVARGTWSSAKDQRMRRG